MKCKSLSVQECKSVKLQALSKKNICTHTRPHDYTPTHLHACTPSRLHPYTPTRLHAFTLTELLVAIAILSIMFTLLFIPMTQAFDHARRGRIMANLQNAADFALEWMVRELTQAVDILPQERVDASGHPLNLLDDNDNPGDDDTLSRIDFVARFPDEGRVTAPPTVWSYQVITYYLRRADPSRAYQYMDAVQPSNRRQIFRAQWIPDLANADPEPARQDQQGRWIVQGAWFSPDLSRLPSTRLISHNALTPVDMDITDLRFTVERRPSQDPRLRKPVAVVIELSIRQPTPGARIEGDNPNETDVPSLFIRRRVKVVLQNVQ